MLGQLEGHRPMRGMKRHVGIPRYRLHQRTPQKIPHDRQALPQRRAARNQAEPKAVDPQLCTSSSCSFVSTLLAAMEPARWDGPKADNVMAARVDRRCSRL